MRTYNRQGTAVLPAAAASRPGRARIQAGLSSMSANAKQLQQVSSMLVKAAGGEAVFRAAWLSHMGIRLCHHSGCSSKTHLVKVPGQDAVQHRVRSQHDQNCSQGERVLPHRTPAHAVPSALVGCVQVRSKGEGRGAEQGDQNFAPQGLGLASTEKNVARHQGRKVQNRGAQRGCLGAGETGRHLSAAAGLGRTPVNGLAMHRDGHACHVQPCTWCAS